MIDLVWFVIGLVILIGLIYVCMGKYKRDLLKKDFEENGVF